MSSLVLIIDTIKIFVGILTKKIVEFVILIVKNVTQYYRKKSGLVAMSLLVLIIIIWGD